MKKLINIYPSHEPNHYDVFCYPFGKIATVHGFDIFPYGIITMLVAPFHATEHEVRKVFDLWYARLQEQIKALRDNN